MKNSKRQRRKSCRRRVNRLSTPNPRPNATSDRETTRNCQFASLLSSRCSSLRFRIESILTLAGYERQLEKSDDFRLKWVQCNQSVNWNVFKDGEQMVNHIQGEDYFTTKLQLWQSLQTYEKIALTMQKRPQFFMSLNEYVPLTFKLDEKQDRDAFFSLHQRTSTTLSSLSLFVDLLFLFSRRRCLDLQTKWTQPRCVEKRQKIEERESFSLGKGIYLVRDIEGLKTKFAEIDALDKKKQISLKPMKRIIQRFVLPCRLHLFER